MFDDRFALAEDHISLSSHCARPTYVAGFVVPGGINPAL
jgi:hypothetical protein